MFINKIIFLILNIILTLILPLTCSTNGSNSNLYSCVEHTQICHPYRLIECCDTALTCKRSISRNDWICVKEAKLGEYCEIDEDCDATIHAKCSENNECVCRSKYLKTSDSSCAPLLGEFCWKNERCINANSECIDNECKCKHNYFLDSTNTCLRAFIGTQCENDADCGGIKFATCLENKTCACALNTIAENPRLCLPLLDVSCQKNDHCKIDNSECIQNKCVCKPQYLFFSNGQCITRIPCNNNSHCEMFINKTRCSNNNQCECEDDYGPAMNNTVCALLFNIACSDNELCATENSFCHDNKCQCKANYVYRESKCVPITLQDTDYSIYINSHASGLLVELGKSCEKDEDCKNILYSRCSLNKICVCKEHSFSVDKFTCAPALNGFCLNDEQCIMKSSHCKDNTCQCKALRSAVSYNQCKATHLLYTCDKSSECSDLWHSKCSLDNLCTCNINNVAVGTSCLPILGGYCWRDDQCSAENSACINYWCACKPNYVAVANNLCIFAH
ncbi:rh5-interacting protein isoform X2 [Microplitis demolitor]|uniref:rh5-interacting protein isoform X2 n=1 Tax=Microplitis demolitor TaxID=69319 RepID=UPI0004CD9CCC|nr:rh5-interacting protein isoform X2 [Microplitis demolitor]